MLRRSFATHKQPPPLPTTALAPRSSAAVISDALSHVHDRRTQMLYPIAKDDLDAFLRIRFPEKCNIQTLGSVFSSFATAWPLEKEKVDDVYFEYDGFMWRATIRSHSSYYAHRKVAFTNIKLPNDGFFYTSDYNGGNTLVVTEATNSFVTEIIAFVKGRDLLIGNYS